MIPPLLCQAARATYPWDRGTPVTPLCVPSKASQIWVAILSMGELTKGRLVGAQAQLVFPCLLWTGSKKQTAQVYRLVWENSWAKCPWNSGVIAEVPGWDQGSALLVISQKQEWGEKGSIALLYEGRSCGTGCNKWISQGHSTSLCQKQKRSHSSGA